MRRGALLRRPPTLHRMLRKRGGWLTLLFLGEMLTATAMGWFEDQLATAIVLALFVPLIISRRKRGLTGDDARDSCDGAQLGDITGLGARDPS